MNSTVKVALAQVDLAVGAVTANTRKIIDYASRARDELQADLVVFPELSICGYPPEDLLFHAGLRQRTEAAIAEGKRPAEASPAVPVAAGRRVPEPAPSPRVRAAARRLPIPRTNPTHDAHRYRFSGVCSPKPTIS